MCEEWAHGLSVPLLDWLEQMSHNDEFDEDRVTVVGLVGKQSDDECKTSIINTVLRRNVFVHRNKLNYDANDIDVYYASELSVLFVRFNGYGDIICMQDFFHESTKDGKELPKKGFFDVIAQWDVNAVCCLALMLSWCHILLYVEQCCRFDLNCCHKLQLANLLRLRMRDTICASFNSYPKWPKDWANSGRLSNTRLLFCYERQPLRADLPAAKKRELLDKLEQSLESQIRGALRQFKLIGSSVKGRNCCSISSSQYPFVHIFSEQERPPDIVRESLVMLLEGLANEEYDKNIRRNELNQSNEGSNFQTFLMANIDEFRYDCCDKFAYEVPKMKWLSKAAKILCEQLFGRRATEFVSKLANVELNFSESMHNEYVEIAKSSYSAYLFNFLGSHDTQEKRKQKVFNKEEHEAALLHALNELENVYHGLNLEQAKCELRKECDAVWESKRACEHVSLTGNVCIMPVHRTLSDLDASPSKRIAHSSGARYLSTCNCGSVQALRNDPFTLKEANYDFYQQSYFRCCKILPQYEFEVFTDEQINSADSTQSIEKSSPQTQTHEEKSIDDLINDGTDLEMLMDRDNYLQEEGMHRESIQSPFRMDECDMVGGEIGEVAYKVSNLDISSHSSAEEEGEKSPEVEDEAEDVQSEVEEEDESEKSLELIRHGRAHMDDPNDDLENAREASQSWFNDDVQFRESESDSDEQLHSLSVSSEEHLAQLRKKYKGQFLECVPNSESPHRRPLFPSWSLVCLGPSSIYSHKSGLRDVPNFTIGSQFLLPVDIYLVVDYEKWDNDVKIIFSDSLIRSRRPTNVSGREKVKLFIGFEYECPRGHRFFIQDPKTPMQGSAAKSKEAGISLLRSDVPLWMPCTCRRLPQLSAQLMRFHVVTPKAPVTITLNPRVQPSPKDPIFDFGEGPMSLEWAKYYVLRLPYVYASQHGPIYRPIEAKITGKVFANCVDVRYIPLH